MYKMSASGCESTCEDFEQNFENQLSSFRKIWKQRQLLYGDQIGELKQKIEKLQADKNNLGLKYVKCKAELEKLKEEPKVSICLICRSGLGGSLNQKEDGDQSLNASCIESSSKVVERKTPKKLDSLAVNSKKKFNFKEFKTPSKAEEQLIEDEKSINIGNFSIPETCPNNDSAIVEKLKVSGSKNTVSKKQQQSTPINENWTRPSLGKMSGGLVKQCLDINKNCLKSRTSVENETVLTSSLVVIENSVNVTEIDPKNGPVLNSLPENCATKNEVSSEKTKNKKTSFDANAKTVSEPQENSKTEVNLTEDSNSIGDKDDLDVIIPSPVIGKSNSRITNSSQTPDESLANKCQSQFESTATCSNSQKLLFESSRKSLSASKVGRIIVSDTPSPKSKRRLILKSVEKTNLIPETYNCNSPETIGAVDNEIQETDSLFVEDVKNLARNNKLEKSFKNFCSTQMIDRTKLEESLQLMFSPVEPLNKEKQFQQKSISPKICAEQSSFSQPCEIIESPTELSSKSQQQKKAREIRKKAAKITYTKSFYSDGQSKLKLIAKGVSKNSAKKKQTSQNKKPTKKTNLDESIQVLEDSFDVVPNSKNDKPSFKYQEVVRGQVARNQMTGKSCKDCEDYYKSAGLLVQPCSLKISKLSQGACIYEWILVCQVLWL